jgi:succinoglycan biosynthesis protein ExoU
VTASTATAAVIAAYNAEATLERAVLSALSQPDVAEVCVVDDCSNDGTRGIAEELAKRDARVIVRRAEHNAGPSAARNLAIAETSAPWIAILDADDYMLDGRLAALHRHVGDADFIADRLMRVSGDAAPPPPSAELTPASLSFTHFVLGNLGARTGPLDLGYLKPMFRRAFIERHGLRYREDMRLGEDYEFYARALALGARFLTCQPAGYVSIERGGSLSKAHSETDLQRLRDCDDAFASIRPLTPDEGRALKRHWNSVDCRLQWRRLISAVKNRDVGAALSTFRSPQAVAFLAACLGEQAWLRGTAFARGDAASGARPSYPQ